MALSILGIGTVSALGSGIQTLKDGLDRSRNPEISIEEIESFAGPVLLPVYKAQADGLDAFVPKRALRRVDPFARMALLSSHLAIEDSSLEIENMSRVGIVFGSGHGASQTTFKFLDGIIDDGDVGASPTHFANSVHNALASQVSIFMKTTGPCSTVTCFEHSVSQVFFMAQTWLDEGIVDFVLAGFGDEYCDVLGYASAGYNGYSVKKNEPLNFEKCSFSPGEGHLTFLLTRTDVESKYGKLETINCNQSVAEVNASGNLSGPVFLAAKGNKEEGAAYKQLNLPDSVEAHSHLYGSMPLGAAFEIASAAVSIKSGQKEISCVEYAGRGRLNIYSISM